MTEQRVNEERLKFLVVREEWSEYKIKEDGTLIKMKPSISEIIKKSEPKNPLFFNFSTQFFKEQTADDKGTPSQDFKILPEDIIQEVAFEKINEPTNIYDVPDQFLISMKGRIVKAKKTRKFDMNGNRIYTFEFACDISIMKYPPVSYPAFMNP